MRRTGAVLSAFVMLLALPAAPAAAEETKSNSVSPASGADFTPHPVPPAGDFSGDVVRAAELLDGLTDRMPEALTGAWITGPNSVGVSRPGRGDARAAERSVRDQLASAGLAGRISVTFVEVKRSRAEIRAVKAGLVRVLKARTYDGQMTGVGEDQTLGVVVVYAGEGSQAARIAIHEQYGDSVIFRHLDQPKAAEFDRSKDSAPHYAGAGYRLWNSAHTSYWGYCSAAFTVVRAGVRYMLTAGHCVPGSGQYSNYWADAFTSSTRPDAKYYFGTRYTTTIAGTESDNNDGTQDQYGDWALIKGSSYASYTYSCAHETGTCSYVPIGFASYSDPSLYSGACTSGRTTGQTCRMKVTDSQAVVSVAYKGGSLSVNQIAIIRSDQNLDGVYDCTTIKPGDSGGAVQRGLPSRPGYYEALGIITAYDDNATGGCFSFYTKLKGVDMWDTSIYVPTF